MNGAIRCIINRETVEITSPPGTVTLDYLRHRQNLPGTKEGCREGECGACTILLGEPRDGSMVYRAVASCLLPVGELEGKHIVTIEGVNMDSLTPIQQAIVDEGASQCGFCTPGIIMSLTGFFLTSSTLDYEEAIDALDGNICRCTGYLSIQRAIKKLCNTFIPKLNYSIPRLQQLIEWFILPEYFLDVFNQLKNITQMEPQVADSSNLHSKSETIIAGATDLYVQRPDELSEKELNFISRHPEFSGIRKKNNWIFVGSGTSVQEFQHSPLINEFFPNMKEYLKYVSSTIMRNRATLAGNIVNASPIGDLSIILLALRADLCLIKGNRRREMPINDFFKDYKKIDLEKGEIIETIEIPIPFADSGFRYHFEKVSRRRYLDIASCNSAISIETDNRIIYDIHISAGGVAPIPLYLKETCAFLRSKEINRQNLEEALEITENEISPISDVRGSASYKTKLLINLIYAHFNHFFPVLFPVEARNNKVIK